MNKNLHKRIVDAKVKGLAVYEMPTFCEIILGKIPVQHVSDLWFVYVPISGVRKTTYNQKVKKILDIMFSLIVLTVLSPVILITAVAIKLDSPGPVFYVQRRIGWREQPFNLVKFRSMQVGTENHREFAGRKNDPRITRVGKILRVSRFDEIPQLSEIPGTRSRFLSEIRSCPRISPVVERHPGGDEFHRSPGVDGGRGQ